MTVVSNLVFWQYVCINSVVVSSHIASNSIVKLEFGKPIVIVIVIHFPKRPKIVSHVKVPDLFEQHFIYNNVTHSRL